MPVCNTYQLLRLQYLGTVKLGVVRPCMRHAARPTYMLSWIEHTVTSGGHSTVVQQVFKSGVVVRRSDCSKKCDDTNVASNVAAHIHDMTYLVPSLKYHDYTALIQITRDAAAKKLLMHGWSKEGWGRERGTATSAKTCWYCLSV